MRKLYFGGTILTMDRLDGGPIACVHISGHVAAYNTVPTDEIRYIKVLSTIKEDRVLYRAL